MTEHICRQDDEKLYQPQLHSRRIRQLYWISRETRKPMTVVLDHFVSRGVTEYNNYMNLETNPQPLEALIDQVSTHVSYFTLQRIDALAVDPDKSGYFLSFITDDLHELENENLNCLMREAFKIVFPDSVDAAPEVPVVIPESLVPPIPRNQ